MREDWGFKKMGEIATFSQGIQVGLKHHESSLREGYVRFIRIVDYTQNTDDIRFVKDPGKKYCVNENDIVMVRYGTPGLIGRGKAGVIANNLFKITITQQEITNDYLSKYLSQSHIQKFLSTQGSSTMPALNFTQLKTVGVHYPKSTSEQKQIVRILDDAFAAIDQAKANIEKNIQNAKELFQSKLNEIFSKKGDGWEEKTLIDTNKFIDYRGKTPKKTDSGIRLITAKNVKMGYLKMNPKEFIAVEDYDAWMTRGIPTEGDVLFTTEAPLANVTLLNTSEKIALAQRIITLCPNRDILKGQYLSYCLQSKLIQDIILDKGTGATVTGIKSRLLKEIIIPIAPIPEQENIITELNLLKKNTDNLVHLYLSKIVDLEDFKKSILQKAFTGELTLNEVTI